MIKADGLAAGKGVVVAMSKDEAFAAIDMMLSDNKLGDAGARVVIEEFLAGEEASFIVMVDGKNVLALATSQDHKRLLDGDQGPNTGGMGAYSPAPVVTPDHARAVLREVIQPVMQGMEKEGITYTGFLYAGLMISPDGGLKVLEFNCRMGDPETQPIMLRLKSDLATIVEHAIDGTLDTGRSRVGQAHRAGRGDGGRQLSRHAAQGRCDHRLAEEAGRRACVPCRHRDAGRQGRHQRRSRAVRHRTRRHGQAGAAPRLRDRRQIKFDGRRCAAISAIARLAGNKSLTPAALPMRRVPKAVRAIAERYPLHRSIPSARKLAAHLKRGGLIAYPTESCYGLGCDPDNRNAVLRLLKLKQRPQRKGLILIASHYQQVARYLATAYASGTNQVAARRRAGDHVPDAGETLVPALVARRARHAGGAPDGACVRTEPVPQRRQRAGLHQRQSQRAASGEDLCRVPANVRKKSVGVAGRVGKRKQPSTIRAWSDGRIIRK